MLEKAELEHRIKQMAAETYSAEAVRDVHCFRDDEHVYGPVVWIHLVIADDKLPFDPQVSLPFNVRLRLAFDDWGETAFPITTFYAETQYRALHPVAA